MSSKLKTLFFLYSQFFQSFIQSAQKLIFGEDNPGISSGKIGSVQSLSGTGALRLAFDWIKLYRAGPIYISDPTWVNHYDLIKHVGLEYKLYPYWNDEMKGLDFEAMIGAMDQAPLGSIFLIHACAHNPTGCDPTTEQWKKIAQTVKERQHFVIFDSAYQGFATGDFEKDAFSIRYFIEQDIKFLLCQSFSKNFGLYSERVGCLHAFTDSSEQARIFESNVSDICLNTYSVPPKHGAYIVDTICRDPELFKLFLEELKIISSRIVSMRVALRSEIEALNTPGQWNHITDQIGMFSFIGLNKAQCARMNEYHHVYLLSNSRISMAGLNSSNVKYVANAINETVRNA